MNLMAAVMFKILLLLFFVTNKAESNSICIANIYRCTVKHCRIIRAFCRTVKAKL